MLLGLDEASSNRIGSPVDNILTYCYHYDPQTNTHRLIVARVVQLGGLAHGGVCWADSCCSCSAATTSTAHEAGCRTHGTATKVNG